MKSFLIVSGFKFVKIMKYTDHWTLHLHTAISCIILSSNEKLIVIELVYAARDVLHMDRMRSEYRTLVRKTARRCRNRWKDNININLSDRITQISISSPIRFFFLFISYLLSLDAKMADIYASS